MYLYEYDVKKILSKAGICIPHGIVAVSSEEVKQAIIELGGRAVLKPQFIHADKNKPVNVVYASSPDEGLYIAQAIFNNSEGVYKKILVEEKLEIQQEIYLGIKEKEGIKTIIASAMGGIEVDKFDNSSRIHTLVVDSNKEPENMKELINRIGFTDLMFDKLLKITETLYQVFMSSNATLLEINRLGVIPYDKRKLVAIDVKMNKPE